MNALAQTPMQIGLAQIHTQPKSGLLVTPTPLPEAPHRVDALASLAVPSNQWYSSVLFAKTWHDPIHAHPATYRTQSHGFEIGYPQQTLESIRSRVDVVYPHRAGLILQASDFAFERVALANKGDFSVQLKWFGKQSDQTMTGFLVHGSPLSYYELSHGHLRIPSLKESQGCSLEALPQVFCRVYQGRYYAVIAPEGGQFVTHATSETELQFKQNRYFTVALLPDGSEENQRKILKHAFAFVTDSHVQWSFDEATHKVKTQFSVTTKAKQGSEKTPLLGLYPHHQKRLQMASTQPTFDLREGLRYESIRGGITAVATASFTTEMNWQGILPRLPSLQVPEHQETVKRVMVGDVARSKSIFTRQMGQGTYWHGKGLSALAQLMNVAEQEGVLHVRDQLQQQLQQHLQMWFEGKGNHYFMYDKKLGTLVGYPDEYGSVKALNDHHFHYGYWINAVAQIALRHPQWVQATQWGGIVDWMINDIAHTERRSTQFPFLRNFDPYEGHSWASGDAAFPDGNNQESSSEAVNAWAGLILYGEATRHKALRDLGIWLYTQEVDAIKMYWLDVDQQLFPKAYQKPLAAMVFGGRYAYNTWWTEEPRQIQGINLLPITPASVYLGSQPEYVKRFFEALESETQAYKARGQSDGTPADVWQDILASFMALSDPDAALAWYKPRGDSELGDTRTRTLHWLYSLKEMGTPDHTVQANTTLYGVFKKKNELNGQSVIQKTYVVYNASEQPITVTFTDGYLMTVPAQQLKSEVQHKI